MANDMEVIAVALVRICARFGDLNSNYSLIAGSSNRRATIAADSEANADPAGEFINEFSFSCDMCDADKDLLLFSELSRRGRSNSTRCVKKQQDNNIDPTRERGERKKLF
jgi:hypothetical protein